MFLKQSTIIFVSENVLLFSLQNQVKILNRIDLSLVAVAYKKSIVILNIKLKIKSYIILLYMILFKYLVKVFSISILEANYRIMIL